MPTLPDLDRLKSQLLTSGLQQKDFPLYQVIDQLIQALRQTINTIDDALGISDGTGTGLAQSIATINNEKASLPNSRQLTAGTGIQFMDTFNRLIISGSPIPGSDGEMGEEGPMGFIGPQGPRGAAGVSAAGSMPYWFPEEADFQEPPPLLTLTNPLSIPEAAIHDDNILARIAANESITGEWTFTTRRLNHITNIPEFVIANSAGAADEKTWRLTMGATTFNFEAINDAYSANGNAMVFTRSGYFVTTIKFYTNNTVRTTIDTVGTLDQAFGLRLSGRSAISIAADQTAWNPSGLGAVVYFYVTPTAPGWVIRGITAQAAGTIIIIFNTIVGNLDIAHEDGAAAAANRIILGSAVNKSILQNQSMTLYYDATISRWVSIARST